MIINPFDLSQTSIDLLLKYNNIIETTEENRCWKSSIFPKSTVTGSLLFDFKRQITKVDDNIFNGLTIVGKQNFKFNTGKYVKCIEIGDYNDSIKRYIQLNKHVDYVRNNNLFVGPKPTNDLQFEGHTFLYPPSFIIPQDEVSIEYDVITTEPPFYNNKQIIYSVVKWAIQKGIKYIYCINENRPYVINEQYLTNCVYYTVKGSY